MAQAKQLYSLTLETTNRHTLKMLAEIHLRRQFCTESIVSSEDRNRGAQ